MNAWRLFAPDRAWIAYGLALVAVAVAALVRFAFEPWLSGRGYFLFFTVAILFAAVFAGRGPAILATIVAVVFIHVLGWSSGGLWSVELLAFAIAAVAIIWIAGYVTSLRRQSEASEQIAARRARRADDLAEELNLLIDGAAGYAIYMLDPQGNVTIWNKAAERLKGWTESEIIGRHFALFYSEAAIADDKPGRDLAKARDEGRCEEEDWRLRKDGSEFLAHVTMTALYDKEGELKGFGKVIRDVTDQRANERKLGASASHVRSILATIPDAMVVIDEAGKILSFSNAAEQLFGYTEAEIRGANVSCLMPSPDRERHDSYLHRYLHTGEKRIIGTGRTVVGLRRDGTVFPMELSVGEAISEGDRVFTGFVRDLTKRHAQDQRIEQLRSDLVHAARVSAMGTMASTLAHELNQPITAVVNFVSGVRNLLEQNDPDDRAMIDEGLAEAYEEALRAGAIVRRLREFVSHGEVGKSVEDLPDLIDGASKLALIGAREKGVEARFDLDRVARSVLVDKVQIQQVLINLMRNAIEAMSQSPIRLLTVSSIPDDGGMVRVSVCDTGPGVAPEIAENLFRAFNSTKSSGLGLGLSICRTIVEANGGRIWMEPGPTGGACFRFTLPRSDMEITE